MADQPAVTEEAAKANEALEQAKIARRWIAELGVSEKAQERWLYRAKKIIKLYRKEGSENATTRQFAMLWSNTETVRPAIYARPPQPVVSRRFDDADPVGREASEVLERGLAYSVDKQDLDGVLRQTASDFVLIARGQAWERYVPTHGDKVVPKVPVLQITDEAGVEYEGEKPRALFKRADDETMVAEDAEVHEDGEGGHYIEGEAYRPLEYEESITDYVAWEDFGHGVARIWAEVPYVWRRVYMCREELEDRFGEETGKAVPLDWGPREDKRQMALGAENLVKKAAIYEIWDKASRKVYWVSKSYNRGPLDVREDPLGLDGFFPCPRPLLGTCANDSLFPVPDYVYYQDQAEEIDELTAKIGELQSALKVVGFYAAMDKTDLSALMNVKNTRLVPVKDWAGLKEDGGARGKIEWWPIDQVVAAIKACIDLRRQLIEDVYQITGVADILRGSSDPRETATAAALKGQWGPLRIRERQNEIQRFARDILRIKGEVIAEHFQTETLIQMTGVKLLTQAEKEQIQQQIEAQQAAAQQPPMPGQPQTGGNGGPPMLPPEIEDLLAKPTWDEVQALFKNNAARQFRVDIETDSTIEPNEQEEKERTVEFIGALSGMISQWGPAVEAKPELAPLAAEIIKWGTRKFRAGRAIESAIDSAFDAIAKAPPKQEQAPAPKGKSPEELQIDVAKVQAERERNQQDFALGQQEMALEQGDQALKERDQNLKLVIANRDPNPQAIG